ncbi:MAG: four-helix bundle copper-binding protein [Gemmatimonadaceae bacterium]|nr:four-helix bundle copper-binding protein [Gemmatimonadaceae bacterium]
MDEGHDHEHDEIQQCIEECLNCHAACTMTAQYALGEGGDKADPGLVGVLLDCAEICQTSANFMLRGSPYHGATCAACAELCRASEEALREFADDEQLAHCAEMCASCATSCEQMAAMDAEGDEEE